MNAITAKVPGAAVVAVALLAGAALLVGCRPPDVEPEEVPAEEVRQTIADWIDAREGTIELTDPASGEVLTATFDHVHEAVEPTPGGRYVACADFTGPDGTVYDIDYYVRAVDGEFLIEDWVLHKAAGETVLPDEERRRLDQGI